ncbi:MAG: 2Fe-2S iron-sulfur cluster-binding protein [Acidimicrobiales bacterium]
MTDRTIDLIVNSRPVVVPDDGASLCEVLRDRLGLTSVKDGCSPQGQCGCCTVWVDGAPRVSCVTPTRRVRGREITTLEGLDTAGDWAEALTATGGSQCGFCTPGIVMRLAGRAAKGEPLDDAATRDALKAHLCRCTGWQTITEAAVIVGAGSSARSADARGGVDAVDGSTTALGAGRDRDSAVRRASLEGGAAQSVGSHVALGAAGFADDTAPEGALVAVRSADGDWVVAETLTEARRLAGKVQGRRTTVAPEPPLAVPSGEWDRTLRTSWVEPGYLETDAAWCVPGGEPSSPLANGGAFGAKVDSDVGAVARRLADEHGRPVRVLFSREDCVRLGAKRPPLAAGVRADGTGEIVVARTPGVVEAIAAVAPGLSVTEVDVAGPPTSTAIRGAGWVEAAVLVSSLRDGPDTVTGPSGVVATATVDDDGIRVTVACGDPLDEIVLRSYCIGAAHMAFSWVTSERLTVDADGEVQDLTVRSFGIVRAVDTPRIEVTIEAGAGPAVNGSDAVFAAVAAATWRARGFPESWPCG